MAPNILPPDSHALLPPLLACLPTAFVSPRPPPALLPLLSPILRQRVTLLSDTTGQPSNETWLALLCWNSQGASDLVATVETTMLEPHPVSGEVELGDIDGPMYRRLDRETLQAQFKLPDLNLLVVFVWCELEQDEGGASWLVSEVKAHNAGADELESWSKTMREADESLNESSDAFNHEQQGGANGSGHSVEGEDDYWAQYDNTPSQGNSANLPNRSGNDHAQSSEADYYGQYASVQPALDNDDPSGRAAAEALASSSTQGAPDLPRRGAELEPGFYATAGGRHADMKAEDIVHTRPSTSHFSPDIARIESSAEAQSRGEIAVQQHISTSLKSLFRLARASGMPQAEFNRIVKTELELLSMMSEAA